jgi:hypothetical protein
MTPQDTNQRIEDVFRDPMVVRDAIERGIADAARSYAQNGELMAAYRQGKVVWVDPVTFAEVSVVTPVNSH